MVRVQLRMPSSLCVMDRGYQQLKSTLTYAAPDVRSEQLRGMTAAKGTRVTCILAHRTVSPQHMIVLPYARAQKWHK